MLHTERVAILDAANLFVLRAKMSKISRKTCLSCGQIVAKQWGDLKDFAEFVDVIPDEKAVRPGSTFLTDLCIKTISVNFEFLFQENAMASTFNTVMTTDIHCKICCTSPAMS